jgi:Cu(I)/Ag(I) efflux system membrane fusion protein
MDSPEEKAERAPSREPSPAQAVVKPRARLWTLVKVIELRLRFVLLMAATGLGFAYWDTIGNRVDKWLRPAGGLSVAASASAEFFCPMHPNVVRTEAGSCPICGMPLSRRVKGHQVARGDGLAARLQLSPSQVAQAGVQTSEVAYAPLEESVTTVGAVVRDETRSAVIPSKIKGKTRVERLFVDFEGAPVAEGQPLAEVYSAELYMASYELLLAQRTVREAAGRPAGAIGRSLLGDPNEKLQAAIDKLELWGITKPQIEGILKAGKADYRMTILAPMGGYVARKNVVKGQIVEEGEVMFELADISHVWVKAQIFEDQVALVRPGQAVQAKVEGSPGGVLRGRVAFVDRDLDPATRTVGIRFDVENPDFRLRPGMYAAVTLKTPVAEISPYRERMEAIGAATGATALARLTAAEQKTCPVTGLRLGAMGDPVAVEVAGKRVWTCCVSCTPKVKAHPARYLARLAPAPAGTVLAVPESAVVDTGVRKLVYVETEPGIFEGRDVVLGPRSDGQFPVIEGLSPGDKVATRGAFLINAEERLEGGAGAMHDAGTQEPSTAGNANANHQH